MTSKGYRAKKAKGKVKITRKSGRKKLKSRRRRAAKSARKW